MPGRVWNCGGARGVAFSDVIGSRNPLRRLVLGAYTYLGKVEHKHHVLPLPTAGECREGRCREVFSAFLDGPGSGTVPRLSFQATSRIYFATGADAVGVVDGAA